MKFGDASLDNARLAIAEMIESGLMQQHGDFVRLTVRGRFLSNEVFQGFILADEISYHMRSTPAVP